MLHDKRSLRDSLHVQWALHDHANEVAKEGYLRMDHRGLPWVDFNAQEVGKEHHRSNCESYDSQHCARHRHVGKILLRITVTISRGTSRLERVKVDEVWLLFFFTECATQHGYQAPRMRCQLVARATGLF
jgi:hypothetical protein